MSEVDKKLLDPAVNELIPNDGPMIEPPELAPDYVERPKPAAGIDALETALATTTVEPCGFDDGLQLRRDEGGGLHAWKDDRIIRDLTSLEPDELLTIKKYVEGSR